MALIRKQPLPQPVISREFAIGKIREAKRISRRRGHYLLADRVTNRPLHVDAIAGEPSILTLRQHSVAEAIASEINRTSPHHFDVLDVTEWAMLRVPQLDRMAGSV